MICVKTIHKFGPSLHLRFDVRNAKNRPGHRMGQMGERPGKEKTPREKSIGGISQISREKYGGESL